MITPNLKNTGIFQDIDENTLEKLIALGKVIKLQNKKRAYEEFHIADNFYFLIEGRLFLSCINEDGKKIVTENIDKDNFFGTLDFYEESKGECLYLEPYPKTEAVVLKFNKQDFLKTIGANPLLAVKVLLNFSARIAKLHKKVEELALDGLEKRLFTELIKLGHVNENNNSQINFDYHITHERLAQITGSVRETISKVISRLKRERVILYDKNSKKMILDLTASSFSQPSSSL